MRRSLIKFLYFLIVLALLAGVIYYFRQPLGVFTPPCQKPILYGLGQVDLRFNVNETQLLSALAQAQGIWSKPLDKELFAYATSGELKINMTYDYRQEATDKLKKLGIVVTSDQKSYDSLKAEYDVLNRQYQSAKVQLVSLTNDFKQKQAAYEAEVQIWNKRGGAPQSEYERLNQIRDSLNTQVKQINQLSAQVNAVVDNLNAAGTVLNKLIEQLNLNVNRYNNVGASTGEEFQEGVYTQGPEGKAITVFEFSSRDQLVRLLAHEMGHALGLEHTSSTGDIMYYLNEGQNEKLTANDLAALKTRCAIK